MSTVSGRRRCVDNEISLRWIHEHNAGQGQRTSESTDHMYRIRYPHTPKWFFPSHNYLTTPTWKKIFTNDVRPGRRLSKSVRYLSPFEMIDAWRIEILEYGETTSDERREVDVPISAPNGELNEPYSGVYLERYYRTLAKRTQSKWRGKEELAKVCLWPTRFLRPTLLNSESLCILDVLGCYGVIRRGVVTKGLSMRGSGRIQILAATPLNVVR